MVFLKATNSLSITGTITVLGENGGNGGNGGSGDATADCCSDGCNGCDERTFSAGSGAGSGAGGGSGGGIFIEAIGAATISGTLIASGGNGGNGGTAGAGVTCSYSDFFCGDQSITTATAAAAASGGGGSGGRVKIYVAECSSANINATINVDGGTGFSTSGLGSSEEVCGYAGMSEGELSIGWTVFPNPAKDFVSISIHSGYDFSAEGSIEIFNALGKRVVVENELSPEMSISISDLNPGMYTVRILTEKGTEIKKLIKQ